MSHEVPSDWLPCTSPGCVDHPIAVYPWQDTARCPRCRKEQRIEPLLLCGTRSLDDLALSDDQVGRAIQLRRACRQDDHSGTAEAGHVRLAEEKLREAVRRFFKHCPSPEHARQIVDDELGHLLP